MKLYEDPCFNNKKIVSFNYVKVSMEFDFYQTLKERETFYYSLVKLKGNYIFCLGQIHENNLVLTLGFKSMPFNQFIIIKEKISKMNINLDIISKPIIDYLFLRRKMKIQNFEMVFDCYQQLRGDVSAF